MRRGPKSRAGFMPQPEIVPVATMSSATVPPTKSGPASLPGNARSSSLMELMRKRSVAVVPTSVRKRPRWDSAAASWPTPNAPAQTAPRSAAVFAAASWERIAFLNMPKLSTAAAAAPTTWLKTNAAALPPLTPESSGMLSAYDVAVIAGLRCAPEISRVEQAPMTTDPPKHAATAGFVICDAGAYLEAATAPQPPATMQNVPKASATHCARRLYSFFGGSSVAIVVAASEAATARWWCRGESELTRIEKRVVEGTVTPRQARAGQRLARS